MVPVDFENVAAFEPLVEPVVWRQDAAPHHEGTFNAIVMRGAVDSESAGSNLGPVTADVWSVHAPTACAIAAGVTIGDTIERLNSGALLSVQKIIQDESGWWLHCTAEERSAR